MIITIAGLAGTGTSSLAKNLAEILDYPFISSGNIFRQTAVSLGLSLYQLDDLAQSDSKYDLALDKKIRLYAQKHPDCVIDSRLAWYFIPQSLKIKLFTDYHTRISRVANREEISFDQAAAKTQIREEAISDRYNRYYHLSNFNDDQHFDLVIDTSKRSVLEVTKIVEHYCQNKKELKR